MGVQHLRIVLQIRVWNGLDCTGFVGWVQGRSPALLSPQVEARARFASVLLFGALRTRLGKSIITLNPWDAKTKYSIIHKTTLRWLIIESIGVDDTCKGCYHGFVWVGRLIAVGINGLGEIFSNLFVG